MAELRWTTAFLDLPRHDFDAGTAFWRAVTGSGLSAPRGEHDEFASLVPRDGDPYLKVQRIADGPAGIHLDLHTDDVPGFVEHATANGAQVKQPGDYVVMTSPGGFTFCVVGTRPATPSLARAVVGRHEHRRPGLPRHPGVLHDAETASGPGSPAGSTPGDASRSSAASSGPRVRHCGCCCSGSTPTTDPCAPTSTSPAPTGWPRWSATLAGRRAGARDRQLDGVA